MAIRFSLATYARNQALAPLLVGKDQRLKTGKSLPALTNSCAGKMMGLNAKHTAARWALAGLRKIQRFEDGIIIRFLFQRTAPADLASVERMIGHYSTANVEAPPPPALCRWSE